MLILFSFFIALAQAASPVFRFHLASEPASLEPGQLKSADHMGYLLPLLYTPLYKLDASGKPTGLGARRCTRSQKLLTCHLNPVKWSNGTPLQASDYVRAFRRLFQTPSPHAHLLRHLRNASAILKKTKQASELGVQALGKRTLQFRFDQEDPDFEAKLSLSVLSAVPPGEIPKLGTVGKKLLTSGPYQIESYEPGLRLRLKPQNPAQPALELVFVADDEAALTLYENRELDFLQRFSTLHLNDFKKRKDYRSVPVARFDYIGFHPSVPFELRSALSLSLDFVKLQSLLGSPGTPGCASFPESYLDQPSCVKMNLQEARDALTRVPDRERSQPYVVEFSSFGGADHQKVFTFAQAQWQENLNLRVRLQAQEPRVFFARVRAGQAKIFRKGVALSALSCLAAMETFSADSPENLIGLRDSQFEKYLLKLRQSPKNRKLCRQMLERLTLDYRLIPLGRFEFSMLASTRFQGFFVNELGQLDVSQLHICESCEPGP